MNTMRSLRIDRGRRVIFHDARIARARRELRDTDLAFGNLHPVETCVHGVHEKPDVETCSWRQYYTMRFHPAVDKPAAVPAFVE